MDRPRCTINLPSAEDNPLLSGTRLSGEFVGRPFIGACKAEAAATATQFPVEVHGLTAAPRRLNMQISLHDDDDQKKKLLSRTFAQHTYVHLPSQPGTVEPSVDTRQLGTSTAPRTLSQTITRRSYKAYLFSLETHDRDQPRAKRHKSVHKLK